MFHCIPILGGLWRLGCALWLSTSAFQHVRMVSENSCSLLQCWSRWLLPITKISPLNVPSLFWLFTSKSSPALRPEMDIWVTSEHHHQEKNQGEKHFLEIWRLPRLLANNRLLQQQIPFYIHTNFSHLLGQWQIPFYIHTNFSHLLGQWCWQ